MPRLKGQRDEPAPTRIPSKGTLKRYGLTEAVWLEMFEAQGRACLVCRRPSGSGRYVVDHEHVPKWKHLEPGYRRWFVRGILCSFCNSHCVGRFMTLFKARNVVEYLERYEIRKRMQ